MFALKRCVVLSTIIIGSVIINLMSPSVSTAQIESGFGVSASASTSSDCPSFCTGDFDGDSGGGEFASSTSAVSTLFGTSMSESNYNGSETFLPELRAFSSSTGGRGGSATAFGVQGYTFNGTATETVRIDFELDANVLDSGSFGDEVALGRLGVLGISGTPGPFDRPEYFSDFATWFFENPGERLGDETLIINTPNGSESGFVQFNVGPGDSFFVGASLRASSRTGTADAFNTFTSSFSDPAVASQLSIANPVSVAVPEPSSFAFLSALIGGFAARRRRNYRR